MKKKLKKMYPNELGIVYDEILKTLNAKDNYGVDKLYESGKYHFNTKGKMLRPLIMISVNEDLGGDFSQIQPFAVALELIHNYSLVHDDLPAMDDDDYRRGKLTVHKKYDEGTAVLLGDYFLTKAFEVVSDLNSNEDIPIGYLKGINILAKNANDKGMIGGQVLDLNPENLKSKDTVLKMYEYKTSALFKSSFTIPGVIQSIDSEKLLILERLGKNFGILFQILDDFSDIKEDQAEGKITILKYLDIEIAKEYTETLFKEIIRDLETLELNKTKEILVDLYG